MFAKAIKEERRSLSIEAFARVIETGKVNVMAWESGRLPNDKTLYHLASLFDWPDSKLRILQEWIAWQRKMQWTLSREGESNQKVKSK